MNKRRRFKAKRIRKWFNGVRSGKHYPVEYVICDGCGDYIMACTCFENHEYD